MTTNTLYCHPLIAPPSRCSQCDVSISLLVASSHTPPFFFFEFLIFSFSPPFQPFDNRESTRAQHRAENPSLSLASSSVPPAHEPCTLSSRRGPIRSRLHHRCLWIVYLRPLLPIRPQGPRVRYALQITSPQCRRSMKAVFGRYKWSNNPFGLGCVVLVIRLVRLFRGFTAIPIIPLTFADSLVIRIADRLLLPHASD